MAVDQREALLDAGVNIVHRRGFGVTGVREVADAAGVPQGSFTNHFRSKEAFGLLVLDRYSERLDGIMRETLGDEARSPVERLWAYFDTIGSSLTDVGWRRSCVVVDLAAEIPAHSETIRKRLSAILERQAAYFEHVLRLIRPEDGDAARDLGAFVMAAWQGTLLRMKVERSQDSIDRFRRVLKDLIGSAPR